MFQIIAIAVVVLIAAVLVIAASRPDDFHIERTIVIKASPEKIFPLINDFHEWDAWTPFNKDPAMKKTYSGPANGVGTVSEWDGNSQVGKGSIAITETLPPSKLIMKLNMIKPLACHNTVEFTLKATGDSTTVTWGMDGAHAYIAKVMGLFCNMDQMVGKDFEAGLARLKAIAET